MEACLSAPLKSKCRIVDWRSERCPKTDDQIAVGIFLKDVTEKSVSEILGSIFFGRLPKTASFIPILASLTLILPSLFPFLVKKSRLLVQKFGCLPLSGWKLIEREQVPVLVQESKFATRGPQRMKGHHGVSLFDQPASNTVHLTIGIDQYGSGSDRPIF